MVAVALACVFAEPELAATAGPEELLAELDRRQLQAVLRNMAGRNPRLGRQIQREIERLHWDLRRDEASDDDAAGAKQVEQRVGAIIHALDYLPSAEAYWYVGGVVDQLRKVLGEAQQALAHGDSREALNILAGLIAAMIEEWTVLDDSDGIVSEFWYEIDEPLTQALLGAQLSAFERRYWADSLYSWINELGYYGVDDAFDRSLMAAELLARTRRLDRLSAHDLVPPRLWLIRCSACLTVAANMSAISASLCAGHRLAYALKLIELLERVTEAIEFGQGQAWTAEEALTIVQALAAADRPEAVLAFCAPGSLWAGR